MRQLIVVLGTLAMLQPIGPSKVGPQEEALSQDKIPKAVMDALLAKFPKAVIHTCARAKEGTDIVYDIEFTQDGRRCEADIKENGSYINYEKAIEVKDLPQAVSNAIEKRYPGSVLKEVMEETEVTASDEKLSAYEVVLDTADRKEVEVRVSPEGKILEDTGVKESVQEQGRQPAWARLELR